MSDTAPSSSDQPDDSGVVTAVSGAADDQPTAGADEQPDPGPARPSADEVRNALRADPAAWRRVYEAMDWRGEALGVLGSLTGGGFMAECEELTRTPDGALMTVHVWACFVAQPFTPLQ